MHIDPATPGAGQAIRFSIAFSSAEVCRTVLLDFGDGTDLFTVNNQARSCTSPSPFTPGAHTVVTTHVYALPGVYRARLSALGGDLCTALAWPAGASSPPTPRIPAASFPACIAVAPLPAGTAGCEPYPVYGPVAP